MTFYSLYIYGDPNTIPNLVAIIKNIVISFSHVAPIIFRHMNPTTFQTIMKNLHDVPCANLIFQHFTTTFIEFHMYLVTMEMIATTTIHMD